jgi:hypothetical protein
MPNKKYDWKRFWFPRGESIPLALSDDGYLIDPDSEPWASLTPNIVTFESMLDKKCLVLLGEPGIGKTSAMEEEWKTFNNRFKDKAVKILWKNLNEFGSEDRLVREIFEHPTFTEWIEGNHQLHLFLDSLDEGLMEINTLGNLLVNKFRDYPIERLYLRIACRTADWQYSLEEKLKNLWGEESFAVFEMAPLQKDDVITAARANGLDPDSFFREIESKNVVPLAIKPVTLEFLLKTYSKSQCLPRCQKDLYLEGCRLLCEETNQSRRDSRHVGIFSAEQKLATASRLAAVSVFCNRYAVWTNVDMGDVPAGDFTTKEVCGGTEEASGENFKIDESLIKETLGTGLFTSRGANRMGWAHQTYAEFLAAHYLYKHQLNLTQIMSLLSHPGDKDGKIIPQLSETAAWLAGMVPDVFRKVMQSDPQVLLRSDVATAGSEDRAALVDHLLQHYDEKRLMDIDFTNYQYYSRLSHPGLADQLRPYIRDNTKNRDVRRVAIKIAETCKVKEVQDDLINIIFDKQQQPLIRVDAAYAIARAGDDDARLKLKPLAFEDSMDDPDDELKGCALKALWPSLISAEELFSILTFPKNRNFHGAYLEFTRINLVKYQWKSGDIIYALELVKKFGRHTHLPHSFSELMDSILIQAFEQLDESGVLEAFAQVMISRDNFNFYCSFKNVSKSFRKEWLDNDEKRRCALKEIVKLFPDRVGSDIVRFQAPPLSLEKDKNWMIECLKETPSDREKEAWAKLISSLWKPENFEHVNAIIKACETEAVLRDKFSYLITTVKLDSPEAEEMKSDYDLFQGKKISSKPESKKPSVAKQISTLLDQFESGDLSAWIELNRVLSVGSSDRQYEDMFQADLEELPGWEDVDNPTEERILKAAETYVLEKEPENENWFGTSNVNFAAYRAILLLFQKHPDCLSSFSNAVWEKWLLTILCFPTYVSEEDDNPQNKIIKQAYSKVPDKFLETLSLLVDFEINKQMSTSILSKIELCWDEWDEGLIHCMENKLKEKISNHGFLEELLIVLLKKQSIKARQYAISLISLPSGSDPDNEDREQKLIAARTLVLYADDAGWPIVWPVIQEDSDFGKDLILRFSDSYDWKGKYIQNRLTEKQLGDFFIWLETHFPHSQDPQITTAVFSPKLEVYFFKQYILNSLKGRGTKQACAALRLLVDTFPEIDELEYVLYEAQDITRQHTWTPCEIGDILKLTGNQEARLVQNEEQLMEVITGSLKRLEAKLHGETPAVPDIWNQVKKKWRPKYENYFSDYIKRHLEEDLPDRGIIVNREVKILRRERTDLRIDAVSLNKENKAEDQLTVIIEVKGCWNPKLKTAMKEQLVGRYLKNNRCKHGIYLVGWFNCESWDKTDYKYRKAAKIDKDEAQAMFDQQAKELSKEDLNIKAVVIDTSL